MTFYFNCKNSEELLFADSYKVFAYKWRSDDDIRVIYDLDIPLDSENMTFVVFNNQQDTCIMITEIDCMYV